MKRSILISKFDKAWGELNYYQKEGPFVEEDEDGEYYLTRPNKFDIDGRWFLKTENNEYVDNEWYGWLCTYGTYEQKETTHCFDPWCRYYILLGAYLSFFTLE